MQMKVVSGASLAAAAIALAVSGAALTTNAKAASAKIHCMGANSCKGTSACKTASNACKGQNSCKGKGFVETDTTDACVKLGGTAG